MPKKRSASRRRIRRFTKNTKNKRKKNVLSGRVNGLTNRMISRNEFKINKKRFLKNKTIKDCVHLARTEIAYKIKKLELSLGYLRSFLKIAGKGVWGKRLMVQEKKVRFFWKFCVDFSSKAKCC